MQNLWSSELDKISSENPIKLPITILREQAGILGEKTKNLIIGEVRDEIDENNLVIVHFHILAPALKNYRYLLMTLKYNLPEVYPVLLVDYTVPTELFYPISIRTEAELFENIGKILSSEKTIKIIRMLISQLKGSMTTNFNTAQTSSL